MIWVRFTVWATSRSTNGATASGARLRFRSTTGQTWPHIQGPATTRSNNLGSPAVSDLVASRQFHLKEIHSVLAVRFVAALGENHDARGHHWRWRYQRNTRARRART